MSNSDFDNWEPVDDDQDSPESQKDESLGLPFQASMDSIKIKASTSPIRSIQNSNRGSISSMDSTALKSTPADPQLATVDPITGINSPPSKNASALSSVNNIIDSTKETDRTDEASELSSGSFFNNMLSSLSFNNGTKTNTHSRALSESSTQNSPNIISYRKSTPSKKSRRSISSENEVPASPLQQMAKPEQLLAQDYDKRLYVEERLLGTQYRYAVEARNEEFHNIFKSVPDDDRLLDDFSCALSREFLFQGRIYVSQSNLCFNSNLLGWITNLVISLRDVITMEKTSTAGLFPNGIAIETHLGKHQFASFISRDTTFDFIKTVWNTYKECDITEPLLTRRSSSLSNAGDRFSPINRESTTRIISETVGSELPSSRASMISENDSKIEDAILSVDDFTPSITVPHGNEDAEEDDYEDEDENDDDDDDDGDECVLRGNSTVISSADEDDTTETSQKIFKLKNDSGYEYDGPTYFQETSFRYVPEENNEFVLAEVQFNAPPGVVYQLMFSNGNSSFIMDFLKSQSSSQISQILGFDNVNKDGQQYREYSYAKALNYSVGPKSTKCQVLETVLNMDYENYINVLNTTKTPDVPSGNNFSVKTRYMIRWASVNSSSLKISFWVDWTGSSWIKSMIDKSCKTGQIEATEAMVEMLTDYVNRYTEEDTILVTKQPQRKQPQSRRVSKVLEKPSETTLSAFETSSHSQPYKQSGNSEWFSKGNAIVLLLLINTFLLLLVIVREKSILQLMKRNESSNLIFPENLSIDQVLAELRGFFKGSKQSTTDDIIRKMKSAEEQEIWNWLNQRADLKKDTAIDSQRKDQYQRELHIMVRQWAHGEVPANESHQFLQRLDKVMKVLENSDEALENGEERLNLSKIKNAVDYLIDI